jgi:hypothetical protein
MNSLDTLTYEAKAMLEVVSDGLLNDTCPSNGENAGTVIRLALDKIEEVQAIHEEMWDEQREEKLRAENKDSLLDIEEEEETLEELLSDADEEEPVEDYDYSSTRFNVELAEEHEDGSATFHVSGNQESMTRLFEAFFSHAVLNGLILTEEKTKVYSAERKALELARDFEVLMREWETSEDLDYDPIVKAKREQLSEALKDAKI